MRPEPSFARSLVAYGNACLRGALPDEAFASFVASQSFVRALSFRDGPTSHDSASFFSSVRASGATRMLLDASDAPGLERIVVCNDKPLSRFLQRWDRIEGTKTAPWFDAVFVGEPAGSKLPARGRNVLEAWSALTEALEGLVELSRHADLEQWGPYFAGVLEEAHGRSRHTHESPLPPSAPELAHRLAHAANSADVFGGMGSWNDFNPLADGESEKRRGDWSDKLYRAVADALLATAHADVI